uniref:NIF3-like protein 1 n=1 Tax=Octopus bimaculoides TaxID=37653 RepID=A0A0L8HAA7_OCTBM
MTFLSRVVVNSRFFLRISRLKIPPKIASICQKNLCSQSLSSLEMSSSKKGNLSKIVALFNEFMPPSLAESWDNVGLLVEPTQPHNVSKILLTNDLTPEVLNEAIDLKANFILSYHPPIFSPLKRLCQSSWKQKLIVRAIENRIAIYSPHTSCDALKNGVNDWLLSAFGKPPMPDTGIGRIAKLQTSITLTEAIEIIKKHLKLPHLRVATAHGPGFSFTDKTIKTVAVCAGSGSTVLRGVRADLYVSGEMSHHDVLDAIHNGSSVLLCEHSNTERGYLSQLKISLENLLSELTVEVCVSNIDADPLKIN